MSVCCVWTGWLSAAQSAAGQEGQSRCRCAGPQGVQEVAEDNSERALFVRQGRWHGQGDEASSQPDGRAGQGRRIGVLRRLQRVRSWSTESVPSAVVSLLFSNIHFNTFIGFNLVLILLCTQAPSLPLN